MDWSVPSELERLDDQSPTQDVATLWRSDDARLLIVGDQSRLPLRDEGSRLRMTAPQGAYDPGEHLLLGYIRGAPQFAAAGAPEEPTASLRDVVRFLSETERDIATTAVALLNWHRNESFCPRCGTPADVGKGGQLRHCPACGYQNFPRTDPAVIVAIRDDHDRLLLGSQPHWGRRVSVFAGFVEAGESAEQAVHREMAEEVGAALRRISYVASQPWPFPRSLMLGYIADAESSQLQVNGSEIRYADWFSRDRLRTAYANGDLTLPSASSIASRLVQGWLDGEFGAG